MINRGKYLNAGFFVMSSLSLNLIYLAKVLILGTTTCTVIASNDKQYQSLHHDIIITAVPVEIGYEVSH